jgi:putative membrane protein insertion efficiency factor
VKRSSDATAGRVGRLLREAFLFPLFVYRKLISPALPDRCKYYPSCSTYAVQAVRELGILRGTVVAAWRLARCNRRLLAERGDQADRHAAGRRASA